jgi:hypothetical protein
MVVGVGGGVVVGALVVLVAVLVGVDERSMVVLVLVIVGPVLELAQRTARVVVGDVVVIVGVDDAAMRVLVLDVANHVLQGACRCHVHLLRPDTSSNPGDYRRPVVTPA